MPPFLSSLAPAPTITRLERRQGLGWLIRNGVASQGMETLTAGAFVVAFALELGASNLMIGFLAAIPHLVQIAQLVGIYLVERLRQRRLICVTAGLFSRPMLLVMALAAFVAAPFPALLLLALGFAGRYFFGAIVGASWNAWIRDLVPERELGRFFARRLAVMTAVGAILSLAAAAFIDLWPEATGRRAAEAYALLQLLAFLLGLISVYCMVRMPEQAMERATQPLGLKELLARPFGDPNFRSLIIFLGSWNFAVNLAAPFFTVHMLLRLKLDLTTVILLTILSQVANVAVLRLWGRIADRFSHKSVLRVCAPLFILCIFGWIFTAAPEPYGLTLPLLATIHILTGVATAGVTLASGNIGLKLAPRGEATAYLASISLINAAAAGIAPVIGGLTADFFVNRELELLVHWMAPEREVFIEALSLRAWDFFFITAALIGVYSIHRLALVREVGEVHERLVLIEVMIEARRAVRSLSTVAGLRQATEFPLEILRRAVRQRQRRRRRAKRLRHDAAQEVGGKHGS